ncbi:MAG: hypothetical protein HND57_09890 [Planctomycetes bacterium]|nr:hypothetical protein [Planctomycetota bacterium]
MTECDCLHRPDRFTLPSLRRAAGTSALAALALICTLLLPTAHSAIAQNQNLPAQEQPPQQTEPPAADPTLVLDALRQQLRAQLTVENLTALRAQYNTPDQQPDDATRALLDGLDRAIASVEAANRAVSEAAHFQEEIDSAQVLLTAINAELAEAPPDVTIADSEEMPLAERKQQQTQAEAALRTAREEAAKLDTERTRRESRKVTLPADVARTQQRLDELARELLEAAAAVDVEAPSGRVKLLRLFAEELQRRQTAVALEKEQRWIDARAGTLQARLAQAGRRVTQADRKLALWRQSVLKKEQDENAQRAAEAQRQLAALMQAAEAHPAVQKLASEYAVLTNKRIELTTQLQQARADLDRVEALYTDTYTNFVESVKLVTEVGLTNTIGQILLARRADLPDLRHHQQALDHRQSQMSDALARAFQLDSRVVETRDPGVAVQRIMDALEPWQEPTGTRPITEEERQAIKTQIDQLIRDIYTAIVGTDGQNGQQRALEDYTEVLLQLDHLETLLIRLTRDYSAFIDQRVLWIRSSEPITPTDLARSAHVATELSDPTVWKSVLTRLKTTARHQPERYTWAALAAIGVLLSLAFRFRARRRLREIARHVAKPRLNPRFFNTVNALALTVFFATPTALILALAGSVALICADVSEMMSAAGQALLMTSIYAFVLFFARSACRTDGLAMAHFGWGQRQVAATRRHLTWLGIVVIPTVAATMFGRHAIVTGAGASPRESLARIGFTLSMLALSAFAFVIFRPGGLILSSFMARNRGGWIDRLRHIWFFVTWGAPLLLAALAAVGWFYTAFRLGRSLWNTYALALCLMLIYGLFQRWLNVAARRLAIEQARKRREAAAAAAAAAQNAESESAKESSQVAVTPPPPIDDEHDLVIPNANEQTLKLLRSSLGLTTLLALYLIWSSVLPALTMLDRVELWPSPHILPARQVEFPPILLSDETHPAIATSALMTGPARPAASAADESLSDISKRSDQTTVTRNDTESVRPTPRLGFQPRCEQQRQ